MSSGMPPPVSLDLDDHVIVHRRACCTVILPRAVRSLDHVADGVRRVDHEVQHHLVDLAAVAGDRRQSAPKSVSTSATSCIRCAR